MYSRIVMDVDDTISTHRNRDYENAIPNIPVIKKMQELSLKGIDFVLFTARGQISCNGDIKKIEEEKGPVLKAWLKKHNVPYSELRFGKPIGDLYVDDAAMTPEEFVNGTFLSYNGGSNEYVERLGKYVVKECKAVDAVAVSDWYDKARGYGYRVPKVYARTYNKMRMEHIDGIVGNKIGYRLHSGLAIAIATTILSFASIPGSYKFDHRAYMKYIGENALDSKSNGYVYMAQGLMLKHQHKIAPSFCHGDLTTMNVIVQDSGIIYLIDPVPHPKFSSYLVDLAKLRMSLNGYNQLFYMEKMAEDDRRHLDVLDRLLKNIGLYDIVKILEFTCWVRLIKYRYNNKEQYEKLAERIQKLSEGVFDL